MKKHIGMVVLAAGIFVVLMLMTVAFAVEENRDVVLVKTFNKTSAVFDGRNKADAGLHWKLPWPIQSVVKYDARTFIFETPMETITTRDSQTLMTTLYCGWRIKDPAVFNIKFENVQKAQEQILTQLKTCRGEVIPTVNMSELINTDPSLMQIPKIEARIKEKLTAIVEKNYGIEVVVVGIKNLGLPESVTGKVIDLMIEERRRERDKLDSAGKAQAAAIIARASAAAKKIRAFTESEAARIRGEGTRAAAETYKKFMDHPEFAMFLRELETLKASLEKQAVLILDGRELPGLKFLQNGPELPSPAKPDSKK